MFRAAELKLTENRIDHILYAGGKVLRISNCHNSYTKFFRGQQSHYPGICVSMCDRNIVIFQLKSLRILP